MTESLFDAFGVNPEEVSIDPFSIPDNTYNVSVTGAEKKELKEIPYFVIEFTVVGGQHAGKSVNNMLRLSPWTAQERPDDWEAMNARAVSSLKKALLEVGIAENMLKAFNPAIHGSALLGIKGTADIGPNKKGYNTISNFQRQAVAAPASAPVTAEPTATVDQSAIDALMAGL